MAEDPRTKAHNEQIRRQRIAEEEARIKKHGKLMDKVVSGGRDQSGCFGVLLVAALTPASLLLAQAFLR